MAKSRLSSIGAVAAIAFLAALSALGAVESGTYVGSSVAIRFDVSPPLRDLAKIPVEPRPPLLRDVQPGTGLEGPPGPQDIDPLVQSAIGPPAIPAPSVSFNGPPNVSSVSPPDPVGDVGPNHYVAMSNLSFQIFDKAGNSLLGPALNNTLWAGFGGPCQTENAGDPIVLYDQFADRWLLTQFTAAGPTYYNCVALSTTADPTGSYFRWAFSTGSNFPDYPKYGVWSNAYFISTREFAGASFAGVGAYALNRTQMIAGNPTPQVVSFVVPPGGTPYNVGDGLLPADIDGTALPPANSPGYFVGSMDNGGPYGAPQDALTLWKFTVDFSNPPASTFVLANTIPVAAFDSMPAFCSGRSCVPQPGTTNRVDHLGYRQRPLHRLAYRNFGSHESLVTNQSVEASATMSGIRWWELRSPSSSPVIHQEGTYAPGVSDGIHRWMGSIAMDSAGNIALGYSASDGTATFPSVWYTGRLVGDPLGTMPQGEGVIHNGTGSQTGSQRWGDYTSINVDPFDDCIFWYVNQYLPTTSSVGWRLRIGAFRFNQCGTPDFFLSASPLSLSICSASDAQYTVNVGSIAGFTNDVTLGASGQPAPATAGFSPNPVTPPGASTLTIGNTATVAAGTYPITISGTASGSPGHSTQVDLKVFAAAPATPALTAPADGALNQPVRPNFSWTAAAGAESYLIEIATDAGFTNIVASATVPGTAFTPAADLASNTVHYWRTRANNACGPGSYSSVFTFTTLPLPGDCPTGWTLATNYSYGFESGLSDWTASGTGNTWAISAARVHTGSSSVLAPDLTTATLAVLVSPELLLPAGHSNMVLQFWNDQEIEDRTGGCFDGGILEISNDAGASWVQRGAPHLLTDPYNGPINATTNPLNGLNAWCGDPQTWLNSVVAIDDHAGQYVRFRFRLGTDSSVGRAPHGWYLDDIKVTSCISPSHLFANAFESGDLVQWSGTAQ